MAGNKFLIEDKASILRNKLEKLAKDLQVSLTSSAIRTQEGYLFEAIRVLNSFYQTLNTPQLTLTEVKQDQPPNLIYYQQLWNQVLDDLTIIFSEIENIESLTVSNFNYMATEANRLTAKLKGVASKLGDYILYTISPTKDVIFFRDSFTDLSRIDVQSPLLNAPECYISQSEGIVTLPVDIQGSIGIRIFELPTIGPNSNGTVGNNHQLGVAYNGDLSVVLDGNPDSWFEYENVFSTETKEPLKLELILNLGTEQTVNYIRINPNNFGTKTVINVESIDTSLDGQVYISVKDDVFTSDIIEGEGDPFVLAPSTSKYAGQGLYTFTPRKTKYIRFLLEQHEPYVIETTSGEKLRYAIGIRDIEVSRYKYLVTGEFISKEFTSAIEIRKAVLQTSQIPSELSELATIDYSISPDGGGTWYPIQPKQLTGTAGVISIKEVLNFNSLETDSINTATPVKSLRLKAKLSRNNIAFEDGSSSFRKTVATRAESHSIPLGAPFQFVLEKPPVDETLSIIDPLFGSRGIEEAPYYLGHMGDGLNLRTYHLPFTNFPRPVKKVASGSIWHVEPVPANEWLHVGVGGEEWVHAIAPLSTYSNTSKVFIFSHDAGEIRFGNNTNGQAPADNEPIAVWLDAEQLFPSETEGAHLAKLEFSTSSNKNNLAIKLYGKISQVTEVVPRKATIIRLANKNIQSIVQVDPVTEFTAVTQNTFINGKEENGVGEWSLDIDEGIIYSADPTPNNSDITITYTYQPVTELTPDDWEWTTTSLLRDSILIKESGWQTIAVVNESITLENNSTLVDFEHLAIVRGTVAFSISGPTVTTNPFLKEVPFIDGKQELGLGYLQTTQKLDAHTGSGIESYNLIEDIITDTSYGVAFSDSTVFITPRTSYVALVNNGDYYIDRAARIIYLRSNVAISNPGKVTYYYTNPKNQDVGLYSINYRLGILHTQRVMNSTWTLLANYEYTDIRAEYKIARVLDSKNYEVDITNRTVRLTDSEIIKSLQVPRVRSANVNPFYIVNYDYVVEAREDIESLRDFYSPIVKDYAIKALTRSKVL